MSATPVNSALRQFDNIFNSAPRHFGNPEPPKKFAAAVVPPIHKRLPVIVAVSLAMLGLAVAGAWYALRPVTTPGSPPTQPATISPVGPEQSLTYWLTVQKMLNNKPLGNTFESGVSRISMEFRLVAI